MRFIKNCLFIISLLIFTEVFLLSCFFVSFEDLSVECNISETIEYFNEDYICVIFSIAPNHIEFEDSIQLSQGLSTVICDFEWEDNTCRICPREKWTYGSIYSFIVNKELTMNDGRVYNVNIYRTFYYGQNEKYLKLLNCSIINNSIVSYTDNIVFTFNNPVDILSMKDKLSILPSISYKLNFSENNKVVTVIPSENWKTNTYYTWELNEVKSNEQYPLDKKYTGAFYSPSDIVQPKLVSIHPVLVDSSSKTWRREKTISDLYVHESLGFVFSEPIDFETVKNSITFTPSLSGTFIQSDEDGKEYIYSIQKNWNSETEYQIKISTSLKDKNKIPLYEEYQKFFKPKIEFTNISSILLNSTTITDYSEQEYVCNLTQVQVGTEVTVTINFSMNIDDQFKDTAYKMISISSFFPSSAASPSILHALWLSDSQLEILYKGFTKSTLNKNYYVLTISGGNKNILSFEGSFLKDDICVYFIVQ